MIFKLGMQDFSVDAGTITSIYGAVRLGGASAWPDNELT